VGYVQHNPVAVAAEADQVGVRDVRPSAVGEDCHLPEQQRSPGRSVGRGFVSPGMGLMRQRGDMYQPARRG
jgi:hypothetical protein